MFYSASGYVLSKRLVCRQTVGYGCYFYTLLRYLTLLGCYARKSAVTDVSGHLIGLIFKGP